MLPTRFVVVCCLAFVVGIACQPKVIPHPADNHGYEFIEAIASSKPGDEIVLSAGTYKMQTRSGSWVVNIKVSGTADKPIIIRGADGVRPILQGDASQNTINLSGEYFIFKGFEIIGGSHGIRLQPDCHDLTFEDLYIHDVAAVGISTNVPGATYYNLAFRRIEIAHTADTGEGFYMGCNNAGCTFRNSIIENCYVHHTLEASQGDGIEIKTGSHDIIIRNNVIHDVNYPGIFVYDSTVGGPNIVEGNVIWNSGDNGIQVTAGAIIRNNIVFNSAGSNLAIQTNQGTPKDVTVVHNTFYGGSSCFAGRWGSTPSGFVVANNAFYCPSGTAIRVDSAGSGTVIKNNVYSGSLNGVSGQIAAAGLTDFMDAAKKNFFPSANSALKAKGDPQYQTAIDFNGSERKEAVPTAGAYKWAAANPGWTIAEGFKDVPSSGTTTTSNPSTTTTSNQSTTTTSNPSSTTTSNPSSTTTSNPSTTTTSNPSSTTTSNASTTSSNQTSDPTDDANQSGAALISLSLMTIVAFVVLVLA